MHAFIQLHRKKIKRLLRDVVKLRKPNEYAWHAIIRYQGCIIEQVLKKSKSLHLDWTLSVDDLVKHPAWAEMGRFVHTIAARIASHVRIA